MPLKASSLVSFAVVSDSARDFLLRAGSMPCSHPVSPKRSDYRPWLE